jgi:hypothetical protein
VGNYSFYRTVTINPTDNKVGETDTGFAVLLNLTAAGSGVVSDLATIGNGGDIQHTAAGGASGAYTVPADLTFRTTVDLTQAGASLDFEVEYYDAATGALVAWVQCGVIASDHFDIYMIYGNADVATSQENVTGTWDANYNGVWHKAEASATTNVEDSLGANDGTKTGSGEPAQTTGRVGYAQLFDGTNDLVDVVGTLWDSIPANGTVEAWIKPDVVNKVQSFFSKMNDGTDGSEDGIRVWIGADGVLRGYNWIAGAGNVVFWGTALTAGLWYLVVLTWGSAGEVLYANGVSRDTDANTGKPSDGTYRNVEFGHFIRATGSDYFDGSIDEVRISNVARTANYVTTCYNNQSSPSTFYSVGEENGYWVNPGAGNVDVATRDALALGAA